MNRQFTYDELNHVLEFQLKPFEYDTTFDQLHQRYHDITQNLFPDGMYAESNAAIWNTFLDQIVSEVEMTLHSNATNQTSLLVAERELEEFEETVGALQYIFEEIVTHHPKNRHDYVRWLIDCQLFQKLLDTSMEFRFVDTTCIDDNVSIYIPRLPSQDRLDTLNQFIAKIEDLFSVLQLYNIYPDCVNISDGSLCISDILKYNNVYRETIFRYYRTQIKVTAVADGNFVLFSPFNSKQYYVDRAIILNAVRFRDFLETNADSMI